MFQRVYIAQRRCIARFGRSVAPNRSPSLMRLLKLAHLYSRAVPLKMSCRRKKDFREIAHFMIHVPLSLIKSAYNRWQYRKIILAIRSRLASLNGASL